MELKTRFREQVLAGEPASAFDIIDCHTHLGYWQNFNIPAQSAEDMVRLMDRAGIRCCISAAHAGIGPDFRLGNDYVLKAVKQFPGRFHGYCCINPNYPAGDMIDELKRCLDVGMIGIKMHPCLHRYMVNGEGYRPAWEFAQEQGAVVLCHTAAGEVWDTLSLFEHLAPRYPNAKIILGHAGFGYEGGRQCCELARKFGNVYMDIASSISYTGLLERLVRDAGADRVLFATDLPFIDCRPQVGRVAFSALTDEELQLLLAGNARRLFGI